MPCIPCITHSTTTGMSNTRLQAYHYARCWARRPLPPLHRAQHCHCCLKHQVASELSTMLDFGIPLNCT